ncbi:glutathione S-transferase family protein [Phaeobacter sp. C3_T13_0]|uniref:glutathione S-transferase family protein n=1 Tax=Phaeobacter cretensis TaxID=3342641 RepID=UPI0039BC59AF
MMDMYCLHYAPDNASLVIRLALEEMGQNYETALVDRRAGALHDPAYRALNPAGLIPVLETPDGAIFETAAILLWLGDRHPDSALVPAANSPQRAALLKWLFHASNTLHADLRILFYPGKYIGADPETQQLLQATMQERIMVHLRNLDAAATATPSLFTAPSAPNGDEASSGQPTVLTLYLACMMRWMALYPRDSDRSWFHLADTPQLARLLSGLENRPSTAAAIKAEGLGPTPFTQPHLANPPEGSAT